MKLPYFIPELLRHLFRKPITMRYPFEKRAVPEGFRGTPILMPEKCIVCKACERDCPAFAIEISTVSQEENRYRMVIHNDRCIHCGQCAESCPTCAIVMNTEYELAAGSRRSLKAEHVYVRAKVQRPPKPPAAQQPAQPTEPAQ